MKDRPCWRDDSRLHSKTMSMFLIGYGATLGAKKKAATDSTS